MQISVFDGEPGNKEWQFGLIGYDEKADTFGQQTRCFVSLNGTDVSGLAQRANEDEGWVDLNILTNPNDPLSYKYDEESGEWLIERKLGSVKIEFKPI